MKLIGRWLVFLATAGLAITGVGMATAASSGQINSALSAQTAVAVAAAGQSVFGRDVSQLSVGVDPQALTRPLLQQQPGTSVDAITRPAKSDADVAVAEWRAGLAAVEAARAVSSSSPPRVHIMVQRPTDGVAVEGFDEPVKPTAQSPSLDDVSSSVRASIEDAATAKGLTIRSLTSGALGSVELEVSAPGQGQAAAVQAESALAGLLRPIREPARAFLVSVTANDGQVVLVYSFTPAVSNGNGLFSLWVAPGLTNDMTFGDTP
jgi:hypothetical protein